MSYVYIISNESMPGLVKIGKADDVEARIAQLTQSTSAPTPFMVEYTFDCNDLAYEVERHAHTLLKQQRVNTKREFFEVPACEAATAVSIACKAYGLPSLDLQASFAEQWAALAAEREEIRAERETLNEDILEMQECHKEAQQYEREAKKVIKQAKKLEQKIWAKKSELKSLESQVKNLTYRIESHRRSNLR